MSNQTTRLHNHNTSHTNTPTHSYWILLPITIVMVVTGILRHYLTVLLQSPPKPLTAEKLRESRSLLLSINLRTNASVLPRSSFNARKAYLVAAANDGKFLADPEARGKPKQNPMGSPEMMEGMMGMMKGNVAMMVPQTLIMGWINAFFAGFVLCKCMSDGPLWRQEEGGADSWQGDVEEHAKGRFRGFERTS